MVESIGSLARFQEFVGLRATRPARLMNPAPLAPEAENTLAGCALIPVRIDF